MVPRQCGLPGSVTLSTREWGADPYGPSLCGGCLAWRYTSRQGGGWKVRATSWAVSPPNCGAESCPKSGHYQDLSRVSFEECMCAKSLQSCLTLCSPMDCSLPGSSVKGFSRQEYWSELPCPPPGDLPDLGIELVSLMSLALAHGFFTARASWTVHSIISAASSPHHG